MFYLPKVKIIIIIIIIIIITIIFIISTRYYYNHYYHHNRMAIQLKRSLSLFDLRKTQRRVTALINSDAHEDLLRFPVSLTRVFS